jgi:hypothetical protein
MLTDSIYACREHGSIRLRVGLVSGCKAGKCAMPFSLRPDPIGRLDRLIDFLEDASELARLLPKLGELADVRVKILDHRRVELGTDGQYT